MMLSNRMKAFGGRGISASFEGIEDLLPVFIDGPTGPLFGAGGLNITS